MTEAIPFIVSTTKSDAETAADLLRRMEIAIAPVLQIMDEAIANGLLIQLQMQTTSPFNRYTANLSVVKYFFKQ